MSYRPYLPGVLAGEPVTIEVEYVEIMSVFHPSESWGGVTQIDKIHFYFHFMYIDALIRDATCLPTLGFGGAKVIVNLVIVKRWAGRQTSGEPKRSCFAKLFPEQNFQVRIGSKSTRMSGSGSEPSNWLFANIRLH